MPVFITSACYFLYIRYFGLFLVEENTLYMSCLSAAKHLNSSKPVIPTEQSDEIRRVRQCRQRMVARSMGNAHAVRVAKRRHCQRISQKPRTRDFFGQSPQQHVSLRIGMTSMWKHRLCHPDRAQRRGISKTAANLSCRSENKASL